MKNAFKEFGKDVADTVAGHFEVNKNTLPAMFAAAALAIGAAVGANETGFDKWWNDTFGSQTTHVSNHPSQPSQSPQRQPS